MSKSWNWGILATGHIAGVFAKALKGTEGANLVAVGSRTKENAEKFAKEYGVKKAYGSYTELVQDREVDVIYISSPMACHREHIRLCLENNKHVICEKTATLNAKEWLELMEYAKEKKLFLMEAMWTKCLPSFKQAKRWAAEGRIGKVRGMRGEFSFVLHNPSPRMLANELGGGALLDVGVYPMAIATEFLGYEPEEIKTNAYIGDTGVDRDAIVILEYKDAYGALIFGFDADEVNDAVVIGEKGRIVFDREYWRGERVWLYDLNGEVIEEFYQPHPINGYEYEILEVHNALNSGKTESESVPNEATYKTMCIMDKCRAKWGMKYEGENL